MFCKSGMKFLCRGIGDVGLTQSLACSCSFKLADFSVQLLNLFRRRQHQFRNLMGTDCDLHQVAD